MSSRHDIRLWPATAAVEEEASPVVAVEQGGASHVIDADDDDSGVVLSASHQASFSENFGSGGGGEIHRRSLGTDASTGDTVDIRAMLRDHSVALTLTREQYLFWTHSLMFPSSSAYNMGFVLHLEEPEVDQVGAASGINPASNDANCLSYFSPTL